MDYVIPETWESSPSPGGNSFRSFNLARQPFLLSYCPLLEEKSESCLLARESQLKLVQSKDNISTSEAHHWLIRSAAVGC